MTSKQVLNLCECGLAKGITDQKGIWLHVPGSPSFKSGFYTYHVNEFVSSYAWKPYKLQEGVL